MAYIHSTEGDFGDTPGFAEPQPPFQLPPAQPLWRREPSIAPEQRLRFPAFETIPFRTGTATPGAPQLDTIRRVAQHITNAVGTGAFSSVRCVGYIGAQETGDIGLRRAQEVQWALRNALGSSLASRIQFFTDDCGYAVDGPKVEIYLWVGTGGPAPVPCARRVPSRAELMPRPAPPRQETPEERLDRMLQTLPPKPAPGRSFDQWFREKVDGALDSAMRRLNVPPSLRGRIRKSAYEAVSRGAEEILKRLLAASDLPAEAQEAIRETVRAAAKKTVH